MYVLCLWLVTIQLYLLAGCAAAEPLGVLPGDPNGPALAPARDGSPIRTDSLVYTLRRNHGTYDAYALAVYVNRSRKPVAYARCMPEDGGPMFDIVRAEPDTARAFVGGVWACVGGVPTGKVAPGDSLIVPVRLGSTDSPAADPPITIAQRIGLFRITFALCARPSADSDACKQLPIEQRRSNVFRIAPPR